jgi:hypothetical protein
MVCLASRVTSDTKSAGPRHLYIAPANVDNHKAKTRAYVDPWEIEYHPNPVLFPHLRQPLENSAEARPMACTPSLPSVGQKSSTSTDSLSSVSSVGVSSTCTEVDPAQIGTQNTGPHEMDATESEYNPWLHSPIPFIKRVPHRWEQTIGVDRMFFDIDRDKFSFAGKRKISLTEPLTASRRRRLDSVKSSVRFGSELGLSEKASTSTTCVARHQVCASGTTGNVADMRSHTDILQSQDSGSMTSETTLAKSRSSEVIRKPLREAFTTSTTGQFQS